MLLLFQIGKYCGLDQFGIITFILMFETSRDLYFSYLLLNCFCYLKICGLYYNCLANTLLQDKLLIIIFVKLFRVKGILVIIKIKNEVSYPTTYRTYLLWIVRNWDLHSNVCALLCNASNVYIFFSLPIKSKEK